jgi:hypothetical protein|tara:strand:- start:169 stop:459 length:291 start_codon:yes stop_codon:yes gene_type:complete
MRTVENLVDGMDLLGTPTVRHWVAVAVQVAVAELLMLAGYQLMLGMVVTVALVALTVMPMVMLPVAAVAEPKLRLIVAMLAVTVRSEFIIIKRIPP